MSGKPRRYDRKYFGETLAKLKERPIDTKRKPKGKVARVESPPSLQRGGSAESYPSADL